MGVKDLFENGGLKTDINDLRNKGRGGFTNKAEDFYKFRVPQLYNLGDGGPYFHGSSKQTLKEVVEYFNDAVPENGRVPASQLSPFFKPLNLSEVEKEQLVAFLKMDFGMPISSVMYQSVLIPVCVFQTMIINQRKTWVAIKEKS